MTDEARWRAVVARDEGRGDTFFYGVRSTGVYCRPSCPSRRPRRDQVVFFEEAAAAERSGFRPCRRCRPERRSSPAAERVERACAFIAARVDGRLTLEAIAAHVGLSPFHLQRLFRRTVGISPRAYVEQCRLDRLRTGLKAGRSVTDALYEAGYGSSSRLYENVRQRLGMTPGEYRRGGARSLIAYWVGRSRLGRLLVAATADGVCAVFLADSDAVLAQRLREEFPGAALVPDRGRLRSLVVPVLSYLEGRDTRLDLPLDVRATAFQRRVWDALRRIPYGETRSYADVARAIGRPSAARAVARACATNPASLVIPCHRILPAAGGLGGYRWGVSRKKALLELERASGARPRRSTGP